jgi:hypothetical protein
MVIFIALAYRRGINSRLYGAIEKEARRGYT